MLMTDLLLHPRMSQLTIVVTISEQVHLALRGAAAVRSGHAAAGQLVLVTPEQTGEGNVDEGCGQALTEHIDPGGLHDAGVVSDLPHASQVGHIGDGDEGSLGVSHTLGLIEEVEFPGNNQCNKCVSKKPWIKFNNQYEQCINTIMSWHD